MTATVTPYAEFETRQIAVRRMHAAGLKAQAKKAHRLAAKLYRAGSPVYAAAREAVQRFKGGQDGGGAA